MALPRRRQGEVAPRTREAAQLLKNRLSNNVGSVKHFLGVRVRALRRARHFALVEDSCSMPTPGPVLVIRLQVRNSVRPMHLFDPNCDHDYYFELLREEERDAQSITRCSTPHHGDFRAIPRANRTSSPARNPIPGASSSTDEPPACGPLRPWQSSALAASLSGDTCCATPANCAPSPAPLPPTRSAVWNCPAW
jgi:hypothetical protein